MSEHHFKDLAELKKEEIGARKKERTYKYISKNYMELKDFADNTDLSIDVFTMDEFKMDKDGIKEMLDKPKYRQAFFKLMSYYELMAYGVKNDFYEFDVVKDLLCKIIPSLYSLMLKDYIEIRREETNMLLCSNFEWLVKEIELHK